MKPRTGSLEKIDTKSGFIVGSRADDMYSKTVFDNVLLAKTGDFVEALKATPVGDRDLFMLLDGDSMMDLISEAQVKKLNLPKRCLFVADIHWEVSGGSYEYPHDVDTDVWFEHVRQIDMDAIVAQAPPV